MQELIWKVVKKLFEINGGKMQMMLLMYGIEQTAWLAQITVLLETTADCTLQAIMVIWKTSHKIDKLEEGYRKQKNTNILTVELSSSGGQEDIWQNSPTETYGLFESGISSKWCEHDKPKNT